MSPAYYSETAKVKSDLESYCIGEGLDIGCGNEKITKDAIGIDFREQYGIKTHPKTVADHFTDWQTFFKDTLGRQFDFIYSSCLVEDFNNVYDILTEWLCKIKIGGHLILVLPIEQRYKSIAGSSYNNHHKNDWTGSVDFLLSLPKELMQRLSIVKTSSEKEPVHKYLFYVVLKREL